MECDRAHKSSGQPFPEPESSCFHIDLTNGQLRQFICDHADEAQLVYCYVVKSIKEEDGHFVQGGSAPNVQGGCCTLCTCKHQMRTARCADDWTGVWVAGFTSRQKDMRPHKLFYLMRVGWAFDSHRELWNDELWKDRRQFDRTAKAAHKNRLGDLFRPINADGDAYDPASYEQPCPGHSHEQNNGWHKDVSYHRYRGRPAALLVGDPEFTFIWRRPRICTDVRLPRDYSCKEGSLGRLIETLKAYQS